MGPLTPTINGNFGSIECWINKEGIANIFSIPKLGEMGFRITYDSMDGHYIVHTNDGEVQSMKDEMVPPYIDAQKLQDEAFLQTVQENFEGSTEKEITVAKIACKSQGIISHSSERHFKSIARKTMIQNFATSEL